MEDATLTRLEKKLDDQQKRLDEMCAVMREFKRNGVLGIIVSIIIFLLPVIGFSIYTKQLTDIIQHFATILK